MDRFEIRQYNGEKMINIREIKPDESSILSAMSDAVKWNNSPAECALLTNVDNMKGFFLECDGEIAGSIGVVTYEPQSMAFINLVIVKEEFRRRGVAQSLVEGLVAGLKAKNVRCLTLEVRASNEPAIGLYEKLGFKEVGRRKGYYSNPKEDALLMTVYFNKEEEA